VDALQPVAPVPGNITDRVVRGERVISTPDLREAEYRGGSVAQAFFRHGARSCVHVALHKEERLLGLITIYREEVRPFTDKQIALLQNFAAQAVIAMENARLLHAIRQRQAELRVTFDNMVDGVAMFDAELRLAAWNRNFLELLDLSEEFLAEPQGFDKYI